MALLEQVDDTDARIIYSEKWFLGGNSEEYNHTSHGTNSSGAMATFKFKGTSIQVFGTIEIGLIPMLDTPTSSYTIDNGSPTTNHDSDLVSLPETLYNHTFYRTTVPMDPNVEHTLVIKLLSSGGSNFWIDRIDVGISESTSTILSTTQVPSITLVPSETNSPLTVVITTSIATTNMSISTSPTSIFGPDSSSESPTSESIPTPKSQFASTSFPTLTTHRNGSVSSSSSPFFSATNPASASANDNPKGISTGVTIGIALGVCIPAVTLIIMAIFCLRMRRRKKPVYHSLVSQYPIISDWPVSKTTPTAVVRPSSADEQARRNVPAETSRWEILERTVRICAVLRESQFGIRWDIWHIIMWRWSAFRVSSRLDLPRLSGSINP